MEIDDKSLEKVEKLLNKSIRESLYGGSTEARYSDLESAAFAFKVLKLLFLKIKDEKGVRETLEKENNHNINFIEGI